MTENTYVSLELATRLLKQLLEARSPELGARLKQRLIASLREQGLPRFDERALGHKSFKVFLEKTQADWLLIQPPADASGDIEVSLRAAPAREEAVPASAAAVPTPRFRSEIWQAFTNPDPARKRFLNKKTGQVMHFKAGEHSTEEMAYSAQPGDFAAIEFIEGERQLGWMEEFLNAVPVVGAERSAYESMRTAPYSSAMNAAFSRALGDKQNQWREFRTSRVAAAICDWAAKRSVPTQLLEVTDSVNEGSRTTQGPAAVARPREVRSSRQDALKLLELLTEHEIKSAVIPVLLSTMLLRSRA